MYHNVYVDEEYQDTLQLYFKSIKIPYLGAPVSVSSASQGFKVQYVQGRLEADEALLGHHWHQILKDHEVVSLGTGPCGAVLSPAPIPALQENQYNMTNKFSNFPKNNNLPVRPED